MIELTLPYPPQANHRLIPVQTKNGLRLIKSPQSRAYAEEAGYKANGAVSQPLTARLEVWLDFYRPRKIGDADNGVKLVFDAMTGIIYRDDKQIKEYHVRQFDEADAPRVEIRIKESEL